MIQAVLVSLLAATTPQLSLADQTAAFKAAGFTQKGSRWVTDCDQPDGPPYEPGSIEQVNDLNGDGLPEAMIIEGSLFCYGNTATGFRLVSKQANGSWRVLYESQGIPTILSSRAGGWPEIEVGGPGFCFSVLRWNGGKFAIHRHQYEGKPCKP